MKTFAYSVLTLIIAGCALVLLAEGDNITALVVYKACALAVLALCCRVWKGVKDYELD